MEIVPHANNDRCISERFDFQSPRIYERLFVRRARSAAICHGLSHFVDRFLDIAHDRMDLLDQIVFRFGKTLDAFRHIMQLLHERILA